MGINAEATLNRRFIEMAKLLNIYLNHFPKHEKYALASRIRDTAYEMHDYITESQKRYHKKTTLTNLDITHERLRMQLHLANELGYFGYRAGMISEEEPEYQAHKRYASINRMVDEIGRMIGGWINKEKGNAST